MLRELPYEIRCTIRSAFFPLRHPVYWWFARCIALTIWLGDRDFARAAIFVTWHLCPRSSRHHLVGLLRERYGYRPGPHRPAL